MSICLLRPKEMPTFAPPKKALHVIHKRNMKKTKRFLSVAIAMTAMAFASPATAQQLRIPVGTDILTTRGDVNCDGFVDVGDIAAIIDILSGKSIISETLSDNGKDVTFNIIGVPVKMIRVEAGSFTMGSSEQDNEKWPRKVTITKDYYIAETEVTQKLWTAIMGEAHKPSDNGYTQWISTFGLGDDYPAYYLSWDMCQEFINRLNALTLREFRMPTEAEWEFAARGGNMSQGYKYPGSNDCGEVAWYDANDALLGLGSPDYGSHPVKQKKPNELGIYDMGGNILEWCSDYFQKSFTTVPLTDPQGPEKGNGRVLKGGSWGSNDTFCRVSGRQVSSQDKQYQGNGLRLALTLIEHQSESTGK